MTSFPTFDGEKDKTLGREMLAAVEGPNGIRTRISSNAFGSKTMLRTRNGMPEFTTVLDQTGSDTSRRGFVAYVRGSRYGALFDPYTLEVLDPKYRLVGALYSTQDFATGWNVSPTDTTHWCDTLVFDGEVVKVNAKAMPLINSPSGGASGTIPFLRKASAAEPYGNRVLNATQKRVFAVGRDYVKSWGGAGVTATLGPSTPGKSMAIGQRVNPATHAATLGKVYYTGTFWDSLGGEWQFSAAEVTMMLAAPYLQSVSSSALVELPLASYGAPSNSTPAVNRGYSLPSTAVGLIGIGEVSYIGSIPNDINFWAVFPWRELFMAERSGKETGTSSVATYAASASHSGTYAGRAYAYACQNHKTFTTENTSISFLADSYPTGAIFNGPTTGGLYRLQKTVDNVLVWDDGNNGATDRGVTQFSFPSGAVSNSTMTRTIESQSITGSIVLGAIPLLSLSISVEKTSGQQRQIVANTSYYTPYLNDPYGLVHASGGMGMNGDVRLVDYVNLSYYKNPPGNWNAMPPAAKDEILAKFQARIEQFAGKKHFDYEGSSGLSHPTFYTSTILSNQSSYSASLSVTTRDYLLFDETNGVYLWIESTLVGSQGAGAGTCTVTVTLKLQTRYASISQPLFSRGYTGTILPEYPINPPAPTPTAVPSPRLRAIFAPLYQEQGSFKGAHYVTAAEEANGALPFHGFNFVLVLQPYDAVSSCNDDNLGTQVFMVPCNLLEMLYAFVFSQEYGVSQYERYPVSFLQRYTDIMSGASALFNVARRVQIRDGVVSNWVGNLGTVYANTPTTELYRT